MKRQLIIVSQNLKFGSNMGLNVPTPLLELEKYSPFESESKYNINEISFIAKESKAVCKSQKLSAIYRTQKCKKLLEKLVLISKNIKFKDLKLHY